MANALRGETPFSVGEGEEKRDYVLLFDANAFCEIEEELSTPEHSVTMGEVMDLIQGGMSMKAFRAIVFGGLRSKHPEITLLDAGRLISEAGFADMAKYVGEAIAKAMPKAPAKGHSQGNGTGRKSPGAGKKR